MSKKRFNLAFLAGTLFILTTALCFASLGNASPETAPATSAIKQTTTPSAISSPVTASPKKQVSPEDDPSPDQSEQPSYCVIKNNIDGLPEQRNCYFDNGTALVEDIDYVARFDGPQTVIDELQKATAEPLDRYSSIFENGDSYCINRNHTFTCFSPVTNSLFTQKWQRNADGQRVFTEPAPYSPGETN
jgi:hypothetical protein